MNKLNCREFRNVKRLLIWVNNNKNNIGEIVCISPNTNSLYSQYLYYWERSNELKNENNSRK